MTIHSTSDWFLYTCICIRIYIYISYTCIRYISYILYIYLINIFNFQFVKDGVFKAELNTFLATELAAEGYSGVQVRHTPARREIIILATRTQNVLGEKGRRIRELTALVQKRFGFPDNTVELYAEKVAQRG